MATVSQKRPDYALAKFTTAFGDRAMGIWAAQALYGLQTADKFISTTEVLALNTTGIVVVPAPGAAKYIMFMGAVVFLDYAGTAYAADAGEDLVFTYTDKSGAAVSQTLDGEEWEGTADVVKFAYPLNAAASALVSVANAPIVLSIASGNWATGNSPLKVRTFFRTIVAADMERISA